MTAAGILSGNSTYWLRAIPTGRHAFATVLLLRDMCRFRWSALWSPSLRLALEPEVYFQTLARLQRARISFQTGLNLSFVDAAAFAQRRKSLRQEESESPVSP